MLVRCRIGELLLGITPEVELETSFLLKSFISNNTDPIYKFVPDVRETSDALNDVLIVARSLFDLREYKKCAQLLKQPLERYPNNQSVIFFHYYSLWIAGLIRK
jgi:anaphase-promoting complex subunit 8